MIDTSKSLFWAQICATHTHIHTSKKEIESERKSQFKTLLQKIDAENEAPIYINLTEHATLNVQHNLILFNGSYVLQTRIH